MTKSTQPRWKKNKTVWGRRYGRYVQELKDLNEKSGSHQTPLTRKDFKQIWLSSGDLKTKQSKAVEMAKAQIYKVSAGTARKVSQRLKKAGIDDITYWDVAKGDVSTADIADALDLGEEYHKKKDELMAGGMSASQASKEAKKWISWYWYGS